MFEDIAWPEFGDDERIALLTALNTGKWWRNEGQYVHSFERRFAAFENATRVLAVTNGTHALELALMINETPRGGGVVLPAMTFFSSLSCIQRHGAYPVIADVDQDTWTLTPAWCEIASHVPIATVMPVHYGGIPANMDRHQYLAEAAGVSIIQDAAHGPGIRIRSQAPPAFKGVACYSFQHSKLLPGGEGGAVAFGEEALFERAMLLHNCGRREWETDYGHREIASNFRMTEFTAAVLDTQLGKFAALSKRRRANAERFSARLASISGVSIQQLPAIACTASHYLVQARLTAPRASAVQRDRLVNQLRNKGIPVNRVYPPLFELDAYWKWPEPNQTLDDLRARCPNACQIGETGFCFHHRMLLNEPRIIEQMGDEVAEVVKRIVDDL